MPRVEAFGITGVGELNSGDDVAAALVAALRTGGGELADGDVVVVSSKVVSKAEGRWARGPDRDAAIAGETVRVIAERVTARGRDPDRGDPLGTGAGRGRGGRVERAGGSVAPAVRPTPTPRPGRSAGG